MRPAPSVCPPPSPDSSAGSRDLVRNGRFGTETEAVRAGIRMLADHELKMQALRRDIQKADDEIESGLGKEYASGAELLKDVMHEG
nr:hypothetical protein [Rhizobium sp. P28RR-XV]